MIILNLGGLSNSLASIKSIATNVEIVYENIL